MADDADRDIREAERLRRVHGVAAYLPVCASDDERSASKLGGTPWLGEQWPLCPTCTNPLRFVLQLLRDDVPPSCRWAFDADLIQLFVCDARGKPGLPEWLCQAHGRGWEPFAPSTLVRQVNLGAEPMDLEAAIPIEVRLNVARLEHAARGAFARAIGIAPPDAPTLAGLSARAEQLLEPPESNEAFLINRPWIFPVQRLVRWDEQLDIPQSVLNRWTEAQLPEWPGAGGDGETELEREFERADRRAEQLRLVCCRLDKLAGSPAWVQGEDSPTCRSCGSPMRYLFQIGAGSPMADNICDGIGWLFVCPGCHEGTYTWQR